MSVSKTLTFSAVQNGDLAVLDEDPTLENPAATYGVLDLNNGSTAVASGATFSTGGPQWTYGFSVADADADHILSYYVRCTLDGVVRYLPRTTAYVTGAMLAVGRYTTSQIIEQTFGVEAVHKWLAINEKDDPADYALRAYGFIADAEAEIDDILRGACDVPFDDSVPRLIQTIATNLAAVRFYESRGVVDMDQDAGQPQHRLQYQAKWVDRQIGRIKSGQIKFATETVTRHPGVVEDD